MLVTAFGTSRHMPAKRPGPAGFYRRYNFELAQTDMPGIGPSPLGTVSTEDVSYLKFWLHHSPQALLQPAPEGLILELLEHLVGADRVPDRLGGDMSILHGGRQLGMAKQDLNDPDIGIGIQQIGGETVPQYVQRGRLGDARHALPGRRCQNRREEAWLT
jgi:hypothetical protein